MMLKVIVMLLAVYAVYLAMPSHTDKRNLLSGAVSYEHRKLTALAFIGSSLNGLLVMFLAYLVWVVWN